MVNMKTDLLDKLNLGPCKTDKWIFQVLIYESKIQGRPGQKTGLKVTFWSYNVYMAGETMWLDIIDLQEA